MLNCTVLSGRFVRIPELRYTSSGKEVTNFTLAVERNFRGQDGNRECDFIDCVIWGKAAVSIAEHGAKGNRVEVQGRLQIRSYEDKDGIKRKAAEVVVAEFNIIDWPEKDVAEPERPATRTPAQNEDDLPF